MRRRVVRSRPHPCPRGLLGLIYIKLSRSAVDYVNENGYRLDMNLQPSTKPEQLCRVVGTTRPVRQPKISSQALLGSGGDLIIEHGGREYRLRLTQNGKLILTA